MKEDVEYLKDSMDVLRRKNKIKGKMQNTDDFNDKLSGFNIDEAKQS
jgi:hypothetical protein